MTLQIFISLLLLPTNSICLWHHNLRSSSFPSNENYSFHIARTHICWCNLLFSICQWFEMLSHKPGSHSTGRLTSRTARGFLCEPTWDEEWETVSLYSILTRGSSQSEEGRGRIEKNLFSARELSPHLRNCDKFTSAQKEPIRAQCKAEGSTPRETAKAKEAHRCECGFKSPLATHTVGLRKIQNANKHKAQKG